MKHFTRLVSLLLVLLLLASVLAGCAGKEKDEPKAHEEGKSQNDTGPAEPETEPEETEPEPWTPEDYLDISQVDFSNPTVVIAADDYDGMYDFAKKLQNYEIPEGTIVEITGFVGPSMMTHTVNVPAADGSQSIGTTYEVVGELEFPPEDTKIHFIGVARIGEYYPLLVVPAALYEVVE